MNSDCKTSICENRQKFKLFLLPKRRMPPLCIAALSGKILHLTEEEEGGGGGGGGGVDNGTFKTFNPTFVTFKREKKHKCGDR